MAEDIIRKLTSRKFWLALSSFVAMLIIYFTGDNSKAESVSALIIAGASVVGYLIGEGLADSSNSSNSNTDTTTSCSTDTDTSCDTSCNNEGDKL